MIYLGRGFECVYQIISAKEIKQVITNDSFLLFCYKNLLCLNMPYHPTHPHKPNQQPINNYYSILGVQSTCTPDEIKKAFRKQSLLHHPDKNGDADMFKKINEAREVLSDPVKRKLYDSYGDNWEKVYAQSSNQMGRGDRTPGKNMRVCARISHTINVSLRESYTGIHKRLRIKRNVICNTCNGYGTKNKRISDCGMCQFGTKREIRRIGPMMVQEVSVSCKICQGSGLNVDPMNKCVDCNATGVVAGHHILDVDVPKGVHDNTTIVFKGGADTRRGYEAGDVHIRICVSKTTTDNSFYRKGDDIYHPIKISLLEALTGFNRSICHLDDRVLSVGYSDITNPGDILVFSNEGFPSEKGDVGDLLLVVSIEFPNKLVSNDTLLSELLGQVKHEGDPSKESTPTRTDLKKKNVSNSTQSNNIPHNSNQGPGWECRQM